MNNADLISIHHEDIIHADSGKTWHFSAGDLAQGRGIHTKLDHELYLDWHDVLDRPQTARMHMFPAASSQVERTEKIQRMALWQQSIVQMETMMVDWQSSYTATEIHDLLTQNQLPRPQEVQHSTGHPTLVQLLESFGFRRRAAEIISPWDELVAIADSGELFGRWIEQKQ